MSETQIFANKLHNLIRKLHQDFTQIDHSSLQRIHTISWIVIYSLDDYIHQDFQSVFKSAFQLLTQITKSLLLQQNEVFKKGRRRSFDLNDCPYCKKNIVSQSIELLPKLKKSEIIAPQHPAREFIIQIHEEVENFIRQIELLLEEYKNGKLLDLANRERLQACLGDLDILSNRIEDIYDQLVSLLDLQTIKRQRRLYEIRKKFDISVQTDYLQVCSFGQQTINSNIFMKQTQTELSTSSLFKELDQKQIQLEKSISQKDREIQKLTEKIANLTSLLANKQQSPPSTPQAQNFNTVINTNHDKIMDKSLDRRFLQNSQIPYNITSQEQGQILKQFFTFRIRCKYLLDQQFPHPQMRELLSEFLDSPINSQHNLVFAQIAQSEAQFFAKLRQVPNYDTLYDPELLEPNLKLFIKDNQEIVYDMVTKQEIRKRPRQFMEGFEVQGISLKQEEMVIQQGIVKNVRRKNQFEEEETWDYVDEQGDLHMIKITRNDDGCMKYEESIFSNGKRKTYLIKCLNSDGTQITEEFLDDRNQFSSSKTLKKEKFGQDVLLVVLKRGKEILQKTRKYMIEKDGKYFAEEEIEDFENNVKVFKVFDDELNVIKEDITYQDGRKVSKKDGTVDYIEEKGIKIRKRQYIDDDGIKVNEEIQDNQYTKEVKKNYFNNEGLKIVEIEKFTPQGKFLDKKKITYFDQEKREEEIRVWNNQNKIIRSIEKEGNGRELIRELEIDDLGREIRIEQKTGYTRNNVDIEEGVMLTNLNQKIGSLIKRTTIKDGIKYVELEKCNSFGQKSIIKMKTLQNGYTVIEEFHIVDMNDRQNYARKVRNEFISHEGLKKVEFCDKALQTLKDYTVKIQNVCSQCIKKKASNKLFSPQISPSNHGGGHRLKLIQKEQEIQKNDSESEETNFQDYQKVDEQIYQKLSTQQNLYTNTQILEAMRQIKKFYNKSDNQHVTLDEFRDYMAKFRQSHQKCGENCKHLIRFYAKLGFLIKQASYNRQPLKLQQVKIYQNQLFLRFRFQLEKKEDHYINKFENYKKKLYHHFKIKFNKQCHQMKNNQFISILNNLLLMNINQIMKICLI